MQVRGEQKGGESLPLLCPENPQLGWGFSKAFSFGSVIKTPFDLLKQFAVWQLQMFNK
ncbi:invasin, partial [Yersinia pestis]